jgi:hypothetical protein
MVATFDLGGGEEGSDTRGALVLRMSATPRRVRGIEVHA